MPDLTAQVMPKILDHRIRGLPDGDNLVMPSDEGLSLVNLPGTVTQLLGIPAFGGPPLHTMITDHLGGPYQKVVFLLVDALGFGLFKQIISQNSNSVWGRSSDRGVLSPITSICPSTTASALTTLWTGVGAGAHGVIGYEMWSKTFGMIINNILHSAANTKNDVGGLSRAGFDPVVFMDRPTLGPHLRAHGVKPTTFIHSSIAYSGLSVMQMKDVRLHTYVNEADLWVSMAEQLNQRSGVREFVYIYYSDVDTLMHRFNAADTRVMLQFLAFSSLFERGFLNNLSPAVAQETLLILTADHGSIATPQYDRFDLANHPGLISHLVMQPTCEHRLPFLYIKPGHVGLVRDYFAKTWPDDFYLIEPAEALEAGLFGQGPFVDGVLDRLGDLIAVTRGDAYLWWSPRPNLMAGRHGGLSAGEMLVPFFALPLGNLS
jgi:hypothetical protein